MAAGFGFSLLHCVKGEVAIVQSKDLPRNWFYAGNLWRAGLPHLLLSKKRSRSKPRGCSEIISV